MGRESSRRVRTEESLTRCKGPLGAESIDRSVNYTRSSGGLRSRNGKERASVCRERDGRFRGRSMESVTA